MKHQFQFWNIDSNNPILIKAGIEMLRDHSKKYRNRSIDFGKELLMTLLNFKINIELILGCLKKPVEFGNIVPT